MLQAFSGENPNSILKPDSLVFEEEFRALMKVCQEMNAVLPGHFDQLINQALGESYKASKEQFNECQKKKETLQKKIKQDGKSSKKSKQSKKKQGEKNASDNKSKAEVSERCSQTKLSGPQQEGTEVSKEQTECVKKIKEIRHDVLNNICKELQSVLGALEPPEAESSNLVGLVPSEIESGSIVALVPSEAESGNLVALVQSENESTNERNCVDTINQYYFCRQLESIVMTLVHGDCSHGRNNEGALADDVELGALLLNIDDVINKCILKKTPEVGVSPPLNQPHEPSNSLACQLEASKKNPQGNGASLFSSKGGMPKRSQSDSNLSNIAGEEPEESTRNRSTSTSLREA